MALALDNYSENQRLIITCDCPDYRDVRLKYNALVIITLTTALFLLLVYQVSQEDYNYALFSKTEKKMWHNV